MKRVMKFIFIFLILLSITGCAPKKNKLDPEAFKTAMKEEGFNVKDASSEMIYDYIVQIYLAAGTNYNIEYYNIRNNDFAAGFYKNNVEAIEKLNYDDEKATIDEDSNYAKYTIILDNKYKVVSRVDNTVIFINAPSRYKEDIDIILNKIGY